MPWPEPREGAPEVLSRAWAEGVAGGDLVDERAVVAVPLHDARGSQVGILVSDWPSRSRPSDADIAHVVDTAERHETGLSVALSYANLREEAGVDERRHLARTMHDGIAQEIAAVGFHLDMVRYAAEHAGDTTAPELASLRAEVARILVDLRNDITDLRVGLRPEHGLGAAVSARLQQFGAATGAVVSVVLRESGFRLPASTEIRLYRLLLDVLADAQRHRAQHVDLDLMVAAPHFEFAIGHSGGTSLSAEALRDRLDDSAAELSVTSGAFPSGAGIRVRVQALRRATTNSADGIPLNQARASQDPVTPPQKRAS